MGQNHMRYIVCALALLVSFPASAHELWLEPHAYQLQPGEPLKVEIKIGQHLKGNIFPYLPGTFHRFDITQGGKTAEVGSRAGDIPAVNEPLAREGLGIVALVSGDAYLTYDTREKFLEFVEYDGLAWVLDAHQRRGLPPQGFTEAYQRFAKALVNVGKGGGADRVLGLRFEWVLETNPYAGAEGGLRARLLWQGEPLTDTQARLFIQRGGEVIEQVYRTDGEGRIRFEIEPGDEAMLNAVKMLEPRQDRERWPREVVWKSFWASVTFARP